MRITFIASVRCVTNWLDSQEEITDMKPQLQPQPKQQRQQQYKKMLKQHGTQMGREKHQKWFDYTKSKQPNNGITFRSLVSFSFHSISSLFFEHCLLFNCAHNGATCIMHITCLRFHCITYDLYLFAFCLAENARARTEQARSSNFQKNQRLKRENDHWKLRNQ